MKFAVVGAGAVGGVMGSFLMHAGGEVTFFDVDEELVRSLSSDGLSLHLLDGNDIHLDDVSASTDPTTLADVDTVLVCVKSQHTERVAKTIHEHCRDDVIIVSLQNGIGNAEVIQKISKRTCMPSIVLFNAVYNSAGEVSLSTNGGLILKIRNGGKVVADEISTLLAEEGVEVRCISEDIIGYQYSKLIVNLQNAVTALTGQTVTESFMDKKSRHCIVAAMCEGIEIVEGSGIKLKALKGIDPKRMVRMFSIMPSWALHIGSKLLLNMSNEARNSMWQSLAHGRLTEVEYINGEIVRLAKQHDEDAPINRCLVELIHKAEEDGFSTSSFTPDELQDRLDRM